MLTMGKMSRSAHGLDNGGDSWRDRAACAADPDRWFDENRKARAVHICVRHCPVLVQCKREAEARPPALGIVEGGIVWVGVKVGPRTVSRPGVAPAVLQCGDHCRPWRREA